MVRVTQLSKHFKDAKGEVVQAVSGVSFQAHPGQIYGLLGCNGAGKTTTLRMLSTVLRPTGGTAEVAGHDVAVHPERVRSQIGFLSGSTALYGRLTAREMIEFFGTLYGLEGARLKERTAHVIERLAIGEFADRLCDKLSTGQKQRVSIARTILHDPPVLFFDEPTSGLDVVASQTVLRFIEEIRDQGKTVIFSTHIMSEAERLCDYVGVIHRGELRGEGTVAELKDKTHSATMEQAFLRVVGEAEAVR